MRPILNAISAIQIAICQTEDADRLVEIAAILPQAKNGYQTVAPKLLI